DEYYYSPNHNGSYKLPVNYLKEENDFAEVFTNNKPVKKISSVMGDETDVKDDSRILIIGVPLHEEYSSDGAVFIYQSLEVMQETTRSTTKFIFLAAGVAIILTTIFAFFLSTRITAPLRKMREAAFEVAKGKFDTKVPMLT